MLVFVAVSIVGLSYTFLRPAVYSSSGLLVITWPNSGQEALSEGTGRAMALQREVLGSRSLLDNVLNRLQANTESHNTAVPDSIASLQDMLIVSPVGDAGVIELRAEGPDPRILPVVVDTWMDVYLDIQTASRESASDSADAELREQVSL